MIIHEAVISYERYLTWPSYGVFWFVCSGPTLEMLDFIIRISSTPTFLYFDLYFYSAYAAHCNPVYTITFWARHGCRLEWCQFFSARHCSLHCTFLPCRFKNWYQIEHAFHRYCAHFYTCVKAGTARLVGVPRPTHFVVKITAENLGTGAEPAPFTLSEFAVSFRKKAAPVPKHWPCRAQNVIV